MLSLCGNCEINSCGIVLAFTVETGVVVDDGEGGGEDPVAAAVQGWELLLVAVVAAVAVAVVGRGGGEDEKSLKVLAGVFFKLHFVATTGLSFNSYDWVFTIQARNTYRRHWTGVVVVAAGRDAEEEDLAAYHELQ